MTHSSFLVLFVCIYFLSCTAVFADLPPHLKDKLDQAFTSYEKKKPIHSRKAQLELIQDSSKFLKSQILSFGEMNEVLKWSRVLQYLSEYPSEPMPEPKKEEKETPEAFVRFYGKYKVMEALRKDLVHYLEDKYPEEPRSGAGGDCEMEVGGANPAAGVTKLAADAMDVAHEITPQKPEVIDKGPRLNASLLFNEFILSDQHEGWVLQINSIQSLR